MQFIILFFKSLRISISKMKELLLHVCCGPCASVPILRLKDMFKITLFYYNPNIYPPKEYKKRFAEVKKLAAFYGLDLIEGPYDHNAWLNLVKGFEDEPEGGKRCELCWRERIFFTAKLARQWFATSLTLSPYQDMVLINKLGYEAQKKYNKKYLESNFKKNDGYKLSLEMSKKHNMYRQNYCGCEFSMRDLLQKKS